MQQAGTSVPERFRQGDPEAFEVLFREHRRAVYAWALRIVRDPSAAEDLTIEAFFRMHTARARFDPARGFEGWARRIVTHAALDWLRSGRAEQQKRAELDFDPPAAPVADAAVAAEVRRKTAAAFDRLPPGLRIAAVLSVVEELPHKETAQALGITVTAVKVRVFRALRLLRKDLLQQGITP